MGFTEDLKKFSEKVSDIRSTILTEEATKMSMVVPFFQLLGYDVFNPKEFCPEFTADVGIKKGEKVDYAILINGEPAILVECKWCGDTLDKHGSQLFRYFSTTPAKFGILTNGIQYKFFTDLDESNKMDLSPFLEVNMLKPTELQVYELKKFAKECFDQDSIFSTASELKYSNMIREILQKEQENPSDAFSRYILNEIYDGAKTQKVIDKFKPVIKKAFNSYINDIVNQKITSALSTSTPDDNEIAPPAPDEKPAKIVTTEEELEAFYIIRSILAETVDAKKIVYRDTESYFGILYDDNNRKPICRLKLTEKVQRLYIPDEQKNFSTYVLKDLIDLYQYRELLTAVASRYIST